MLCSEERDAVAALRRHLAASDYARRYRSILLGPGDAGPFAGDVAAAGARLAQAAGRTDPEPLPAGDAALLRLLGLGEAVPAAELGDGERELLAALARAGLASAAPGRTWRTAGWVAVPLLGGTLLADRPRAYGGHEVRVYVGPDSVLLAGALPRATGLRMLDMGAGCGVQGLLAAPEPAEAVLVDIEPRAVHYCALNAELCGRGGRVRILAGDMYQPVAGERFDLIASLPPYVPVPEGVPYSGVANGGPDGLALLRRLLGGAPDHLEAGGQLVAVCQLLAGAGRPLLAREVAALAPGLRVTAEVFARSPAPALIHELTAGLASRVTGWTAAMLAEAYARDFDALGVTEVLSVVLRAERTAA